MKREPQSTRSDLQPRVRDEDFVPVGVQPSGVTELGVVTNPQGLISQVRPTAADQHPAAIYLSHLAPGSRRTMRGALDTMAGLLTANRFDTQSLDWSALRYQHTTALRTLLADLYAPATANKMLAALRGVLQEAWRLGKMSAEEYRRAADLPAVRGSTLPRGRAVSRPELTALFEACSKDKSPAGRRDAAILAVLYNCGLRRSELVALDVADYDPEESAVTIRSGKGRKARISYATDVSQRAIQSWLQLRTSSPGPMFTPINKAGKITLRRMSDQAVRKMLLKRAAQSGVAHFSPHDLRRTMISDLLDAGADISTVQRLAGHANVTTTARYDRRGETAKRRAANLLNVPLGVDDD
ncbi:MAG TPA: tyrosine-type recombinase/integrase [Chloroflexia bacterium]|nr:tyrosine-type recombinase/integrase [Chloroflexia bacterium]